MSVTFTDISVYVLQKQFRREADIWTTLRHKNILPFHGMAESRMADDEIYLVSPWVELGNLARFCAARVNFLDHPSKSQDSFESACLYHEFSELETVSQG